MREERSYSYLNLGMNCLAKTFVSLVYYYIMLPCGPPCPPTLQCNALPCVSRLKGISGSGWPTIQDETETALVILPQPFLSMERELLFEKRWGCSEGVNK